MEAPTELSLDRHGLEVLPPEACWDLPARTPVGRIAFVEGGEPLVFPVTHGVHEHQIVFRTQRGSKLDAGPWLASATTGTWVRILPEEISGRRLPG